MVEMRSTDNRFEVVQSRDQFDSAGIFPPLFYSDERFFFPKKSEEKMQKKKGTFQFGIDPTFLYFPKKKFLEKVLMHKFGNISSRICISQSLNDCLSDI